MREISWGIVLLGVMLFSDAGHALQLAIDRPTLCAHASAAIVGEVTSRQSQWSQGPIGGIETLFDISVERVVHGQAPVDLSVMVPGGNVDGIHQNVEDSAPLQIDRRYLLLIKLGEDGRYTVFGGQQGAFLFPREPQQEAEILATLGACDVQ